MKNFESFESNRWIWRINLALQVLLVLALVGLVNFIGMTVFGRFDLTKKRIYSLSPETISYIRELREPLNIIVTITPDPSNPELDQAYRDVMGLLREFEFASRGNQRGPINVRTLNVYQDRSGAATLGLTDQPNIVMFDSGGQKVFVELHELYTIAGQRRQQFNGERAFALALLEASTRQKPVLYFVEGHGEMLRSSFDPGRGVSTLETQLTIRGYHTETLDLAATRKVPDDASMVVILSPGSPIQRAEQEMLREYLTRRAGRVLLTIDPGARHGLDQLLLEWGILVDDVEVVERERASVLPSGELLLRRASKDHPITRVLAENEIGVVVAYARSVRPDPGRPLTDALQVTGLLWTSESESWGERNYRSVEPATRDPGFDLPGPLFVGTVAERRVDQRLDVNLPGGRIVVFGSGDFLSNQRLGIGGNLTLLMSTINWSLDRDKRLNIPARPVEMLKLTFSEKQLLVTSLALVLGPTLAVTLLGLAVYFARRH